MRSSKWFDGCLKAVFKMVSKNVLNVAFKMVSKTVLNMAFKIVWWLFESGLHNGLIEYFECGLQHGLMVGLKVAFQLPPLYLFIYLFCVTLKMVIKLVYNVYDYKSSDQVVLSSLEESTYLDTLLVEHNHIGWLIIWTVTSELFVLLVRPWRIPKSPWMVWLGPWGLLDRDKILYV